MSDTAILERAPRQGYTSLKDRLVTPAEEAHKQNIADNYRKLRFEDAEAYNSAKEGEPVRASAAASVAVQEPAAPVQAPAAPSAADRIAQYKPVVAPAGNHDLFGEYTFKDGTLYAPQQQTARESVLTAAPVAPTAEDEDAVPTRRTMDTLIRPAAKVAEEPEEKVGFRTVLSTKTKVVLAVVCAAIVLALVLIGVNSGIIRSIESDIAIRRTQLDELTKATQSVQEQIADLTTPESIAEWAAKNNMVLDN